MAAGVDDRILKVRLDVYATDWELIEEVAKISMTTPRAVFRAHFMEIRDALTKSNTTVKLPAAWSRALANLDQKTAESTLQRDSEAIDLSVIHTSRSTNSGFEGVYMHSNPARGFIAQGRDPETRKPGKHLGLFPTAAQAAWARYQHYRKHNLPYGKLEEMMDKLSQETLWRDPWKLHEKKNEKWLRALSIYTLANKGTILPDLSDEERNWETNNPVTDSKFAES